VTCQVTAKWNAARCWASADRWRRADALALALHPLLPGVTVAKEMMSEYGERHGPHLASLR
jgi:hypothetical protein